MINNLLARVTDRIRFFLSTIQVKGWGKAHGSGCVCALHGHNGQPERTTNTVVSVHHTPHTHTQTDTDTAMPSVQMSYFQHSVYNKRSKRHRTKKGAPPHFRSEPPKPDRGLRYLAFKFLIYNTAWIPGGQNDTA
jgi:hypothetical protein